MLTDKDWNRIRTVVDEVVDRQVDHNLGFGMRVTREPDHSIIIRLEHHPEDPQGMSLEPIEYDEGFWLQMEEIRGQGNG